MALDPLGSSTTPTVGDADRALRERALHERETRLTLALDAGQLATWDWYVRENRVAWSDRMFAFYGYAPGEIEPSYDVWAAHIHPDDRARVEAALQAAMGGDGHYAIEFRIVPAGGGAERWLEARGQFHYDEAGAPVHLSGVVGDVTERKRADDALRLSEERFRRLVLALPAALYTTDAEGYVTLFNDRAAELWGRSPTLGKDRWCGAWRVYRPDGTPLVPERFAIAEALRTGEGQSGTEVVIERPDGSRVDVLAHPEPLRDATGAVVGAVNMLVDVTARRQAERDRALLAAIVESSDDAIISKTLDGIITSWNRGAERIFGYRAEEVVGRPVLTLIPEDRQGEEDEILGRLRRGERIEHFETVRLTKDGRLINVALTVSPVRDAEGRIVGASKVARDVTASRWAEAALRESEARFRAIQETSPDGFMVLRSVRGADGAIEDFEWVYANPATEALVGRAPADLLGRRLLVEMPGNRDEGLFDAFVRVVETGERWAREFRYAHEGLDGWFRSTAVRVEDGFAVAFADVTEAKRAEDALRESEARFRAMTDATPMLVWMSDPDGAYTYFNEAWLAFTGRALEDELGDGWTEGIHPDDAERFARAYEAAFDARAPFEVDFRLRHHTGEHRWIVDQGAPRFAPDGTFLGFIGSCFDIHDRRQAEVHARYLAETGTLVEQALDADATVRRLARLAVPAFADWCAVDLVQPDGSIEALAIEHADPEKVQWAYEIREREPIDPAEPTGAPNVIRTGRSEIYPFIPDEMLVAAARDEEHLALMREIGFSSVLIVPVRVGGEVIGAISFVNAESGRRFDEADLATAEEIGRRAGSAMETARLHSAVAESEARFRELAEALPQIIYTSRADGAVDYLNRRWFEYTGQRPDGAHADAVAEVIHPADRPRLAEGWAEALAGGRAFEAEIRLRRHDGDYRWFLTRVVPFRDADGRVTRWLGSSTDIHHQKATEAELAGRVAERTAELERSNRELDQFAYVASHDLKAPLRGIENLASWISKDAAEHLPDESRRHLELLRGRVRRMEELLDSLLTYSRAGRAAGLAEPVDTAALVRETADFLALPDGFTVEVEGELPTLTTYRAPLELVFRNLIANAVKHHAAPEGIIRVAAREAGAYLAFSVTDDGPGIAPEYHERVFGLFQTLRPRDAQEGSGVGLAVVRKTVESLGGHVTLESAPGEGATFTFTWPREV